VIGPPWLELLCCPQNHQALVPVSPDFLASLNRRIESGQIFNQAGQLLCQPLTGGLIRADGARVYPIFQDVPRLMVSEAIPLSPPTPPVSPSL
jgi:uncharacterized protein YbaR (Trm112 family)